MNIRDALLASRAAAMATVRDDAKGPKYTRAAIGHLATSDKEAGWIRWTWNRDRRVHLSLEDLMADDWELA